MKIFTYLYDKSLIWSRHRHAPKYLAAMSFSEASFFPLPPDIMLAPMCLAKPERAYKLALLTTIFSVMGGVFGYFIGFLLLDMVLAFFEAIGYTDKYLQTVEFFYEYGFWVIFIAGFTPIPYKLVTIAAGASSMALLPFIAASLIGRGARFFLVAFLMKLGGERFEPKLRKSVDTIGYGVIVIALFYVIYQYVETLL